MHSEDEYDSEEEDSDTGRGRKRKKKDRAGEFIIDEAEVRGIFDQVFVCLLSHCRLSLTCGFFHQHIA